MKTAKSSKTSGRYLQVLALAAIGVVAVALSWLFRDQCSAPAAGREAPEPEDLFARYDANPASAGKIAVATPLDGSVFPPESSPPTFAWSSSASGIDFWLVRMAFAQGPPRSTRVDAKQWTPDRKTWQEVKQRSSTSPARVTILGVAGGSEILAGGAITLTTSTDPVDAPLFYREVPLPFIDAVKDPARIRWRFGNISGPEAPPVVLENLPVCGNCHSFSADGRMLGMDVDYANDKGSYVVTATAEQIVLDRNQVITWSDYRRDDGEPTFGLLSQVSPDGRYVVSTVKDRSVFVPKSDLTFSQLFFPLKGILAFYDRETGKFQALPGANDPAYVQSNPTWSPDGQYIVFARSEVYELEYLKDSHQALLSQEECQEFLAGGRKFRYDLFRIPFNGGKGGTAVPVQGASRNGRSNFFAKYSPDGKWIVFCQADSFMLLQPDSELFIIPADGGQARRLSCNTNRMNSWHSWSPNGRWLVFASKTHTPYTQLLLTHMDEAGRSSPPVTLSYLTAADRAANIPEFVNLPGNAIATIREAFVNDHSLVRTAEENVRAGDMESAARFYQRALALNPDNATAHAFLGGILTDRGQLSQAHEHLARAIALNPSDGTAHYNRGNAYAKQGRYQEAVRSYRKTIDLEPKHGPAHLNLGTILLQLGRANEAETVLRAALEVDAHDSEAHRSLGDALAALGSEEAARSEWREAVRLQPQNVRAQRALGAALVKAGAYEEAVEALQAALRVEPQHPQALANLAVAVEKRGDTGRAIQLLEQAAGYARMQGQARLEQDCIRRLRQLRRP
jgi:tetratricopeptide (TPR) repeat protein/roadblock/LC7 domain-containing protein